MYVENTLDVVTLLVPISKVVTGPKWIAKTFTFVEKWGKVNAGANLAIKNSPLNEQPELKGALETYNNVTAIVNITTLAGGVGKNIVGKFLKETDNPAVKNIIVAEARNGSDDAQKILDVEAELKAYSETKLGKNWWKSVEDVDNVIIKGDYLPHEYNQILKLGEDLGGGTAEFYKAQQGIEGVFTTIKNEVIPFSLKQVTPSLDTNNGVKNIFREIKDNASKIREGYAKSDIIIKKYCKLGDNPNTIIRIDVTNMDKMDILNYYESIDVSRQALLFGGEGVFKQIRIVDKNGMEIIFDNYNLVN
ncbi:hypothetical protein EG240_15870 [Paenimyroides tangerinum]|uniref:Uncharacterized protein n=1 Tax=Paenimyroides tangerinum TaxID=2488728 RepID=A0A3P3VYL4_9FLAO|nr:hypothetical protein [Paenimyroides tangerinum]RRJ86696.1 hypothetical protein EG240_15870 [Paenimyroides tangerinum]